jgi:hypothetical protein
MNGPQQAYAWSKPSRLHNLWATISSVTIHQWRFRILLCLLTACSLASYPCKCGKQCWSICFSHLLSQSLCLQLGFGISRLAGYATWARVCCTSRNGHHSHASQLYRRTPGIRGSQDAASSLTYLVRLPVINHIAIVCDAESHRFGQHGIIHVLGQGASCTRR